MGWNLLRSLVIAAAVGLAGQPALAQDRSDADQRMLRSYTLTMAKVNGFYAAVKDSEAAAANDPALRAEADALEALDTSNATLTEIKAVYRKYPRTMAFFAKHGLTPDDIVALPFVLLGAGVAAQFGLSDELKNQVSPEQVAFIKANKAALDKLQPQQ